MEAPPPREQIAKLAGRWTTQARIRAFRHYAFIATVRSRRRRWNRKRSAKPFSDNGTPYRSFFAHREANSEGDFAGTFNNYCNLQEFEELFRGHFRDFLLDQVDQEASQKLLNRKVRRWKSSPFRGLNFFDFEHAPIFHGRTRAIGGCWKPWKGKSERNGLLC